MLPGFNHNLRYRDRVFHVQTEDAGPSKGRLVTQVFIEGNLISIQHGDYKHLVGPETLAEAMRDQVRLLMQDQHKEQMKRLVSGEFDDKISLFFGETPPESEAGEQDPLLPAPDPSTAAFEEAPTLKPQPIPVLTPPPEIIETPPLASQPPVAATQPPVPATQPPAPAADTQPPQKAPAALPKIVTDDLHPPPRRQATPVPQVVPRVAIDEPPHTPPERPVPQVLKVGPLPPAPAATAALRPGPAPATGPGTFRPAPPPRQPPAAALHEAPVPHTPPAMRAPVLPASGAQAPRPGALPLGRNPSQLPASGGSLGIGAGPQPGADGRPPVLPAAPSTIPTYRGRTKSQPRLRAPSNLPLRSDSTAFLAELDREMLRQTPIAPPRRPAKSVRRPEPPTSRADKPTITERPPERPAFARANSDPSDTLIDSAIPASLRAAIQARQSESSARFVPPDQIGTPPPTVMGERELPPGTLAHQPHDQVPPDARTRSERPAPSSVVRPRNPPPDANTVLEMDARELRRTVEEQRAALRKRQNSESRMLVTERSLDEALASYLADED